MFWSLDSIGGWILVMGLATIMVLILLLRQQRTKRDLPLWALSGLVGILLGGVGAAATARTMGYELQLEASVLANGNRSAPRDAALEPLLGTAAPGGMASPTGMGGMMGMGGGGGGPGGGAGGGGRGPTSKRQLTSLVRKLELLTGDIAIALTPDQTQAIAKSLDELSSRETMTEDEAKDCFDKLLALLDEPQQAKQNAIGLPFRRGGGGGGGAVPGGGGGAGGPGGEGPAPDANPFAEVENAMALKTLRERLSGAKSEPGGGDSTSAKP